MVKKLFVLLLIVFFSSCEKKPATPHEMILGNWSVVNKDSVKPWLKDIRGFEFLPEGVCDYKLGYLDWERYRAGRVTPYEEKVVYSLGTKTKYSVSRDSFKIFNLTDRKWDRYILKKLNKDTLIIKKDTIVTTYIKKNYNTSRVPDFDAVVVSSSLCFGDCPMNDLIISKNGNVLYKGGHHVTKKGWYTSKIQASEFDKIQRRFKEADYINLKNNYRMMASDGQTVSVSFLKNGKIIKTVEDYSDSAPNEFIWAYMPLITIGQRLDLKPKTTKSYLDNDFFYSSFVTVDEVKGMNLTQAEVFYLVTLFMDARDADIKFDEKYLLRYETDNVKEVKTDGRYYKFFLKNGKTEIKDIGFNFITDNKLSDKFETIKR